MKIQSFVVALSGVFAASPCLALSGPFGLTAERLTDPVGLGVTCPHLSWMAPDGVVRQMAYEIEADGKTCGRVEGDGQLDVPWPGVALTSGSRHAWRVRIWNERGEATDWSAPATFVMGVTDRADWKAKWIGADPRTVPNVDFGPARWLEGTNFEVRLAADRVIDLALAATQPFKVFLNGKLVFMCEGHVFDYRHVRFFDLRPFLASGENALRILLEPHGFVRIADPGVCAIRAAVRDADRRVLAASDGRWGGRTLDEAAAAAFAPSVDLREELLSPAFEKTFVARSDVARATLYVTGLGYYEASLNGVRIGDKLLDPSPTDYTRRVLYSTYVLDGRIRRGENRLRLLLGHGWYDMRSLDKWNYDGPPWRNRPVGFAQLELDYADGTRETVVTDGTWKQVASPVAYDCLREGEVVAPPPVALPEGAKAVEAKGPSGVLEAEELPPTRIVRTFRPTEITADGADRWVVTFPQTVSGWIRLKMRGLRRGQCVTVSYEENLPPGRRKPKAFRPDRSGPWTDADRIIDVYFVKSGSYRLPWGSGGAQIDRFVASADGEATHEPRFVYHGFRHVIIEGLAQKPSAEDVTACWVRTDFPETGSFDCSDKTLTELVRLARNSYLVNFANGFPTDCPHREKLGWTGDAWIASELAQGYFENTAAYRKWMRDVIDTQRSCGDVCGICPTSGWGYSWGNGPVFDAVLAMVPWNLWRFRGDRETLARTYPALKRYLAYERTQANAEGLVANGLDDWNARVAEHKPTREFLISCLYLEILGRAADIAQELGKDEDRVGWLAEAERVRRALRAKYAKGDGVFDNGGQTAQAMAFACGLYEPDGRQQVVDRLADSVTRTDCHADFGLAGAKYVYRALSDAGRADLAYRMIVNPTEPTMVKWIGVNGTLWEDWTFGYSKSHVMLGDFASWAQEYVAGLRRPKAPGYRQVVIEPVLLPGITWAKAETRTPYGRLASSWTLENGRFSLSVTVPPGTEAEVRLPDGTVRRAEPGTRAYDLSLSPFRTVCARPTHPVAF